MLGRLSRCALKDSASLIAILRNIVAEVETTVGSSDEFVGLQSVPIKSLSFSASVFVALAATGVLLWLRGSRSWTHRGTV